METVLDTSRPVAQNGLLTQKPKWLRVKLPTGQKYTELRGLVDKYKLHTICTSGSCPNMGECWGEGTATFMILGNICTRSCGFCGVKTGRPETVEWDEPEKVARSIKLMNIKHAVITSVDRDDLKDGGSIIWAETVKAVRRMSPGTTMETLIPDFQGITRNIDRIVEVAPEVVSHNMETVKRLTREVRIQAKYERSLEVLRYLKASGINRTKSGIMLGLGETEAEVLQTMEDLRGVNLDVLTIGQYLQPSKKHLPVKEFITPDQFKKFGSQGQQKSFLIALKLAQFEFMKKQSGVLPILLFDDIFDKLDESRVARIVQMIDDKVFGQIFISDTHSERTEAIVKETHQSYKIFTL